MAGAGVDELTALFGAAQAQFPAHRFELSQGPDTPYLARGPRLVAQAAGQAPLS